MRGKKTTAKLKADIITKKISNPELSSRDISKELWNQVSNDTVCDVINKDLPQVATQSQIISDIIENDMESIKTMSQITKRYLKQINSKEELDRGDIAVANTTVESALKRSQLLSNKPTERIEHNLDSMSTKELELARQKLLNS